MSDKPGLIIPVDKPVGWTSFQVVNKLKWHLRRTLGIKKLKIGHAGTLDPLASGLLLVCIGGATKQIEQLQSGIKEYSGTMVLGATTPCFDLERDIDHYYPTSQITEELIERTRHRFVGEIEQVPPMFSAVKVDGKRAYVSARNGEIAQIASKRVTIQRFEITAFRPGDISKLTIPDSQSLKLTNTNSKELYRNPQGHIPEGLPQLDFLITCSKGTYLRSVARDFGEALDSGAFLSALRRERIGDFTLADAIRIEEIEGRLNSENPMLQPLKQTLL